MFHGMYIRKKISIKNWKELKATINKIKVYAECFNKLLEKQRKRKRTNKKNE
jgi:hypothetical protein